mmetsp:Transcript_47190/g.147638  ORF Transcript_47190/g.147638 Transcript_47190/m.147638 type:complete len:210 (-) Transcript_47190:335-964(-)
MRPQGRWGLQGLHQGRVQQHHKAGRAVRHRYLSVGVQRGLLAERTSDVQQVQQLDPAVLQLLGHELVQHLPLCVRHRLRALRLLCRHLSLHRAEDAVPGHPRPLLLPLLPGRKPQVRADSLPDPGLRQGRENVGRGCWGSVQGVRRVHELELRPQRLLHPRGLDSQEPARAGGLDGERVRVPDRSLQPLRQHGPLRPHRREVCGEFGVA